MLKQEEKLNQSLAQQVAKQLEELIMTKEYQVGDQLPNEFDLASKLDVGRGTIREAIKLLAARNVVVIKRGLGTFVSDNPGLTEDPLGLTFITDKKKLSHDLMEVRLMVEPNISALAAQYATNDEIIEMEKLCLEIEYLIQNNKNHEEKDIEFHTLIAKASKNLVVPSLIPIIQSAISLFIDLTHRSLKEETIETHRKIIDAIKSGNSEAAKEAMYQHLQYNKKELSI
ncbi:FadR/GntR family transcriptional regulator [Vagococcus intermedius]|uniref:FadR family transcriptional regulator n=1 Tax=Vagococcus intermedius TaxID=2991418 RepID=A0AAF0CT64_9ENTE|nr:FadR/GntR family transcriptional regulator [Vagococcus intermedius]WEG72488.1 FadR family transcriptional regulator [Vagococcus intermedius]WEG74575.1 FadR family transcriptional regulator [Vagococcus intermedius]